MFLQVSFLFLSRQKRGTVLGGRKEGRSLNEEKRDGPWRKRKRGTVLEEKRETDLKELKVRTVKKIKKKIKRTLHKEKKIV